MTTVNTSSQTDSTQTESPDFLTVFRGRFKGIRTWDDLDNLWQRVKAFKDLSWYIYQVGEPVPDSTVGAESLVRFVDEVNTLLHTEHDEDYCGIVYVDDTEQPRFIKIFDPNNLGVSCGFSTNPPLPGWIMSTIPPADLPAAFPPPGNRRRWYQRLLGMH